VTEALPSPVDQWSGSARRRRRGAVALTFKLSAIYWRLKSQFYYGPQFAHFGARSRIRKPIFISNPGGMSFGPDVFVRDGARLEVVDRPGLPPGRLTIGAGVSIEQDVHIVACDDVTIGDFTLITARCSIIDTVHPVGEGTGASRTSEIAEERSHVHIGRRVFIGVNVVIMPGVTIGDNSFIGAGSVVTKDIPANSVAVGAPARVVRTIE